MVHWSIIVGMIVLGYLLGWIYEKWVNSQTGKRMKFGDDQLDTDFPTFIGEILYFSALFSVPLSGNVPLTGIVLAMYLYALFGSFGRGPAEKGDPEDAVGSKWHRMFP